MRDMSFKVADIAAFMKEKSEKRLEDILKVKGEEIENNIRAEENGYIMIGNPRQVAIKRSLTFTLRLLSILAKKLRPELV
ncbi:hypothetical protein [Clostridium frigoriphilum]|uniref:Uncharacterized protein n=1 Tax=Clostridium frigoriphilum TaxID=443253 RepID=A0ABU7UNJ8_9CLOT